MAGDIIFIGTMSCTIPLIDRFSHRQKPNAFEAPEMKSIQALPLILALSGCVVMAPKTPDELVGRTDSPRQQLCVQEDQQVVHKRIEAFLASCFTPRMATTQQWTPVGIVGQPGVLDWTVNSQKKGSKDRVTVWAGGAYFIVTDVHASDASCQTRLEMHAISDLWKGHFQSISDAARNMQPKCLVTGRPL